MITSRNAVSFLIPSLVLGLVGQLQIFWQLCLIELLDLLKTQELLKQQYLIYPRLLTVFSMLVSFTNPSLMEIQVAFWPFGNLALFYHFSVIGSFKWFRMGSLCKNIQLMVEFFKAPFFALPFSYYTLMTLQMILSVILLPMLMILLSTLSVIRDRICGNN